MNRIDFTDPRFLEEVELDGITAYHHAAAAGKVEVMDQMMLINPLHFDTPDLGGNTPLTIAASQNHLKIIKYLISLGAKVDLFLDQVNIMRSSIFGWVRISRIVEAVDPQYQFDIPNWYYPLSELEIIAIRDRIYFERSLTWRLVRSLAPMISN